jgi:uncharacterized cofD-like protein
LRRLRRFLRWLYPGMRVKRWAALVFVGLVLTSFGVLLVANLFAYELTARVGGPWAASLWGATAATSGLALLIMGVRGLVRSVATALVPRCEDRLADVVWTQRCRDYGLRVVAIGGGTGLSALLRGLKQHTSNLTAIVAVSDEGGSSGRLRRELGVPPPGDIRNCLAALADSEQLMAELLQFRFDGQVGELGGHSLGNLLIAALTELTGDFEEAVRQMHEILAIRGRVLPPTKVPVTLVAELRDGRRVRGETRISATGQIERVYLDPPTPPALEEAVDAIHDAEMVVLGPGSLFTSVMPNLLVPGIAQALRTTSALRVYVCNVMTQPGETHGFRASDHVQALEKHLGEPIVEFVLLNETRPAPEVLARYEREGAQWVEPDKQTLARWGYIPITADLISRDNLARHDPAKLARALMRLAQQELALTI